MKYLLALTLLFLDGCCRDEAHIHLFHAWTPWFSTDHKGACHLETRGCMRCGKPERRAECD